MTRVLVTGFGPFPGVPHNPTDGLIRAWRAAPPRLPPGVRLTLAVLDTRFDRFTAALETALPEGPFDVGLHFGVAESASGFLIETRARNRLAAGRADAVGGVASTEVVARGLSDRPTRLPVARLIAALRTRGLPVETSNDAGAYLCNALFMTVIAGRVRGYDPGIAGFVHVPGVTGLSGPGVRGPIDRDAFLSGAAALLRAALSASRA